MPIPSVSHLRWLAAIALVSSLCAVDIIEYSVRVSATPSEAPVQIALSWPTQSATSFTVGRRTHGSGAFTTLDSLAGTATGYTDTSAVVGTVYDYQVVKAGSTAATTVVTAAIRAPAVDSRGAVVLVVDETMAEPLATELTRLEDDLAGDGWQVIRHDVPRYEVGAAGWKEAVVATKALIAADYAAAPGTVNTVFLFGRVPVPYSGSIVPDGHIPDHQGAWPADVYYGDMTGTWTDSTVDITAANRAANDNVPGDGKFDQSYVPMTGTRMELAVGRVDLANMGAFGPSEADLLRRYLDKDHAFRWKRLTATRRGLIDDNFPGMGEAFAASGWNSFAALVGHGNVSAQDWFTTLPTNEYLLAYGCGPGSYTSASGVGNTGQFASTTCQTVFTLLFGSYFGDWDSTNNFLRAPLAMPGWGLTCGWSGRPWWSLRQMAVGMPIGVSSREVQETMYSGSVHIALMGDPTLRLHAQDPPTALAASVTGSDVTLTWGAAPGLGSSSGEGYLVYRSSGRLGTQTRLTPSPIATTTYTDVGAPEGGNFYRVRAVGLETSGSATYLNPSQAIVARADLDFTPPTITTGASGTPGTLTADLTVEADDNLGTDDLTYTWEVTSWSGGDSDDSGATFVVAGNDATVHFAHAGDYTFTVTVTDAAGFQVTSTSATVTVAQVASAVVVACATAQAPCEGEVALHASVRDQFGDPIAAAVVAWSVDAGGSGGTVSAAGVYTAPAGHAGGDDVVRATSGAFSSTVAVSIGSPGPVYGENGCGAGGAIGLILAALLGLRLHRRRSWMASNRNPAC